MSSPDVRIAILNGKDAQRALQDPTFIDGWRVLHDTCSWATSFQSPHFLTTWYDVYASEYQPVFLCAWRDTRLIGLLALAQAGRDTRVLHVAGTHHAEYQVWLTMPRDEALFLREGLMQLRRLFPGVELTIKYVPAEVSEVSIRAAAPLATINIHRRPLMRIDPADIARSLAKKSNKSRLNRLKRVGPVSLEHVDDGEAFDRLLDDVVWQCDLRQGAVNQSTPFRADPLKRSFHQEVGRRTDCLYVTALRVGSQVVSTHIDFRDGAWIYLGTSAYSPFFFQHSPGKLHMLLLGQHLADEGFEGIDLTPGDDAWKERFANEHIPTFELLLHPNRAAQIRHQLPVRLRSAAKRVLQRVGIDPSRFRSRDVARKMTRGDRSLQLYHATRRSESTASESISVNVPADLLRPAPLDSIERPFTAWLARLERGHHVYTCVRDGLLLGVGWLAPAAASVEGVVSGPLTSVRGRLIHDVITATGQSHGKIREALVCAMLVDTAADKEPVMLALEGRAFTLAADVVRFGLVPVSESVAHDARLVIRE